MIVADPTDTPVTGTFTRVAFDPKLTLAGTVATFGLLELKLTVRPPAKGADKVSVRLCVAAPVIERLTGEKLMVGAPKVPPPDPPEDPPDEPPELTCTVWLAGVKPGAAALRMADPAFTPVNVGAVA